MGTSVFHYCTQVIVVILHDEMGSQDYDWTGILILYLLQNKMGKVLLAYLEHCLQKGV